ncbi:hypothetical protein BJX61DRAFT_17384 [Aspergillus egyptiacus]|nr:hypothetical protein BJX61DRAFT_17384 [Aspergillus egyptiacus]
MFFADLPEDILRLVVITHFAGDLQTLALLATLSKRLNHIAIPILYSHVTLTTDDYDDSRKVRRFIMSVFSSPYRARCVRSLELNGLYWVPRQSASQRRKELVQRMKTGNILGRPDRLDMFKLVTVVRRLPLLETHKLRWCTELEEFAPSLDSLVALMLVLLPSLEKLESNWSFEPVFIRRMLPQTANRRTPAPLVLRKLTHLKVNSESPCGNSAQILPFFRMPSLTHFFGSNWGPIRRKGRDDGVENEAGDLEGGGRIESPIIHLELRQCSIDLYTLQTILKQCPSLRTFIFHREWDPRVHVKFSAFSITQALQPLWQTLENVALSFESGIYIEQEGEIHPLDFSQFSALTELHVDAGYLVHDPDDFDTPEFSKNYDPRGKEARLINIPLYDRLPESLEVLHITGFCTSQQMRFLIEDCCRLLQRRPQFPRLRELCIETPPDDNGVSDMKVLEEDARQANILLRKVDNAEYYFGNQGDLLNPAGRDWGMNGEFKWGTKLF